MKKDSIGKKGEEIAVKYLQDKGFEIIEQNWHCQWGEIDIIAKTQSVWIFCEVKTRTSESTQQAFMNISTSKRKKLIASAQQYLHEHELDDAIWQIDAIGIALTRNQIPKIDHVEDALDW